MNFIKVIYFDESSVTDLLQIVNGGNMKTTTDFISDIQTNIGLEGNAGISVATGETKGIAKIFSFISGISAGAHVEAEADISRKRDRVVKNILENTILTDFVRLLEQDTKRKKENQKFGGISKFETIKLHPGKNTFSYLMLMAPYMNMIDGKIELDSKEKIQIDISKIEETMKHGRGYYEFIGESNGKNAIFRFNHQAFRNNYTMSDLTKMDLSLYAVKVGKSKIDQLDLSTEFEFGAKGVKRAEYDTHFESSKDDYLDVLDVLLAGIKG